MARTVAFSSIVIFEMVRVTMIGSQYGTSLFSNLYLVRAIVLSVLLQALVTHLPVMNIIF